MYMAANSGENTLTNIFWIISALEMLEYTVTWFPIELNQPGKEYYFLPNTEWEYRTKF